MSAYKEVQSSKGHRILHYITEAISKKLMLNLCERAWDSPLCIYSNTHLASVGSTVPGSQ